MKITLTFRHIENIEPEFNAVAEDKVSRLERFFDKIHSAELIFDKQGDRIKAQLIVSAFRGQMFIAELEDLNMHAALDSVVDKMERQMKKFNQKAKDKRRRSSIRSGKLIAEMMDSKTAATFSEESEAEETYDEIIEKYDFGKENPQ